MLSFLVGSPLVPRSGRLDYVEAEERFEFEIDDHVEFVGTAGSTTMGLELLQVMISVEFQTVLCAWVHGSREDWLASALTVPAFHDRQIRLTNFLPRCTDVAFQAIDPRPLSFDDPPPTAGGEYPARGRASKLFIRIAHGVEIGLDGDRPASIWLRPTFVQLNESTLPEAPAEVWQCISSQRSVACGQSSGRK